MTDTFQSFVEGAIQHMYSPKSSATPYPNTRFGYRIFSSANPDSIDKGLDDFFKNNQRVAGMATGGPNKLNGVNSSERGIIINPYNQYMKDPRRQEGIIRLEAARHFMDEQNGKLDFPITPEMQQWRERTFKKGVDPYYSNDDAFRQTVVSRLVVGDDAPPVPKEIKNYANWINSELDKRDKSSK